MTTACATQSSQSPSMPLHPENRRIAILRNDPEVLADVYRPESNIVIWERDLSEDLKHSALAVLGRGGVEVAMSVSPENTASRMRDTLRIQSAAALAEDIAGLVDMFCCLFGLKHAGLRLTALSRAMCPRFHVDKIPCRLVTTYQGPATQWLPHECVDRSRLGTGNQGKPDSGSGIYTRPDHIQQLSIGDVALLKGERWEGNEHAGLVHRSPAVPPGESRLLLTVDVIN